MGASPRFKIYSASGEYQAACHEPEAAAVLASFYGEGATVRDGHREKDTVWQEGRDGLAGESFDHVAQVILDRLAK